jgi:hypothetical protein
MVQVCSMLRHRTYIAHTPTEEPITQRLGGGEEEEEKEP